jgi:hypothetical protein
MSAPDSPPELPPHLRARILEAVRSEPVVPRAEGTRRSALTMALGFVAMTVILLAISMPNLRGRPLAYVEVLVLVWTPIALAATWAGVGRGRSMLGRSRRWLVATAVLTPVVLLVSWIPVTTYWPETLVDTSKTFHHVRCIAATMGLALGPFVAFTLVRRGSDPVSPLLTGAGIGTAAAAWGALMLPLICGFTSPVHMLVGHFLPILLVAAAGAALGGRLVAVRAKTE